MSRIAYINGSWVDSSGPRSDIGFEPPSDSDYYFHIPERKIVLRWFNEGCRGCEPLGEVYSELGEKISDIPPYVHPSFRGSKLSYRSKLAWVQGVSGDKLSIVLYCSDLQDFHLTLDLRSMKYLELSNDVR